MTEDTIKILMETGALSMKNGDAHLFFDDVGLLQEIVFRNKRRRASGESLVLKGLPDFGTATAHYFQGAIEQVTYETRWRRRDPHRIASEPKL